MALTMSAAFAGRLSASDPRWPRPSFLLTRDAWTPGQRGREASLFRLGRAPQGRDETLGMRSGVMELKLYDTLTREKRPFRPLHPAPVPMYLSAPTTSAFSHIANPHP